jgi:beta-N-acetylhexosaminidase
MLGPVVVDVQGTHLTEAEREMLEHPLVGMVILFARNFESVEQLRALTAEIHAVRSPRLLIAVDHEGGRVQRFREGFTRLPAMRALGELWDRDVLLACRAALSTGLVLAAELRACGVDLSFAPVLDLDWCHSGVIGDRAFHADARVVSLLALQLVHGMAIGGMGNCGKHFPGHGWAKADSHTHLPVDERPLEQILAHDVAPYRWMGAALAGVMPAHVVYPAVDAEPAGFSSVWIELLRRELGFSGAVFSDDLLMEGAAVKGGMVDRAEAAFAAGCDLVLVCNDAAAAARVLDGVRWQRSPAFDRRIARFVPRLSVTESQALLDSEACALAREDVARLG